MHFPLLHPPSLGSFGVPGLHPSDPAWQSGPWASLFPWGWLRPFRMRERNECFLSVVQASSGRPTRRWAAPPPIFLWLAPTFSLMLIVRFCSLPLLAHCFGGITTWSISFWFWVLNKNFERQCYQTTSIVSYHFLRDPKSADDGFPNKLRDVFVFVASLRFRLYPFAKIVRGNK